MTVALLEPGDRVSWRVSQYVAPATDPKRWKTFYGTVVRLENDPFTGEPGVMVRPDGKDYLGWHAVRHLSDQYGKLDL